MPCEHVFSSGKMTSTDRRNKMSGELMEALQILKYQFEQGHSLTFTQGLSPDDVLKELVNNAEMEITSVAAVAQ